MKLLVPALCVCLLFPIVLQAQSAQEIMEEWLQATGDKEKMRGITSLYSRSSVSTGGLSGIVENWATASGDLKESADFGEVYRTLTVFDAKQRKGWIRDQNGKVRELDGTDLQNQITAAYLSSFSAFFSGRLPGQVTYAGEDETKKFDVMEIHPQDGRSVKVYLDKTTHLPAKQEQPEGDRTLTILFSDYRDVSGIQMPFQLQQTTGNPIYDVFITLQEASYNMDLGSAAFAKPEEAARDYRFTAGDSALAIAFELSSNHIYVQVSVNDSKPLWFLLDTGASFPVINEDRARELGLELQGSLEGRGAGEGSTNVSLVKNVTFQLPGVEVLKQNAATIPLKPIEGYEGRRVDGILGYDFISRFVVIVDYGAGLLHLHEPSQFNYSGDGARIPITFDDNVPVISGTVQVGNKVVQGKFDIDTGSRSALSLNKPFHESHQLLQSVSKTIDAAWGFGVGGQTKQLIGRVGVFQIGTFSMEHPLASFSLDVKGAHADPDRAGIIGGEILRRFRVILDYSRKTMILEPNRHFSEPFHFDMSGMNLISEGEDLRLFRVQHVVADSPASVAGVRIGDHIESIDGRPASEFTLEQIRSAFKLAGRIFQLNLLREGKSVRVKLETHPLI